MTRFHQGGGKMKKCGLTGPVSAEENQDFSLLELEVQLIESREAAETFGQVTGFESSARGVQCFLLPDARSFCPCWSRFFLRWLLPEIFSRSSGSFSGAGIRAVNKP